MTPGAVFNGQRQAGLDGSIAQIDVGIVQAEHRLQPQKGFNLSLLLLSQTFKHVFEVGLNAVDAVFVAQQQPRLRLPAGVHPAAGPPGDLADRQPQDQPGLADPGLANEGRQVPLGQVGGQEQVASGRVRPVQELEGPRWSAA